MARNTGGFNMSEITVKMSEEEFLIFKQWKDSKRFTVPKQVIQDYKTILINSNNEQAIKDLEYKLATSKNSIRSIVSHVNKVIALYNSKLWFGKKLQPIIMQGDSCFIEDL